MFHTIAAARAKFEVTVVILKEKKNHWTSKVNFLDGAKEQSLEQ